MHPPTGYFRLLMYKPPKHQKMRKKNQRTQLTHHWWGKLAELMLLKSQHNQCQTTENATKNNNIQANTKQIAANTREKQIETMQAQNEKGLLN